MLPGPTTADRSQGSLRASVGPETQREEETTCWCKTGVCSELSPLRAPAGSNTVLHTLSALSALSGRGTAGAAHCRQHRAHEARGARTTSRACLEGALPRRIRKAPRWAGKGGGASHRLRPEAG